MNILLHGYNISALLYYTPRVEAMGLVIIQGVTASKVDMQVPDDTSPLLEELEDKS